MDFIDSMRILLQAGGGKQQAAEKVKQIIASIEPGFSLLEELKRETDHRIKHCFKYHLPGNCSLLTIENDAVVLLLFVGVYENAEKWLEKNRGLTFTAKEENPTIIPVKISRPIDAAQLTQPAFSLTENKTSLLSRIEFPEFEELIPNSLLQKQLMSIDDSTQDKELQDIIDLIPEEQSRELMFDIICDLRVGENKEAVRRLEFFRGDATDVIANEDLLEDSLSSGINSQTIVDFGNLSSQEIERLLDGERFENWMLFLHPEQKKIVESEFSKTAILKGVSGSGKTVVLIHRARFLAQKYPEYKIGIITLNRDLAKLINNLVAKLCQDGEDKRIYVEAYYDYFKQIVEHVGAVKYLDEFIKQTPEENYQFLNVLGRAKKRKRDFVREFDPRSGENLEVTWQDFWEEEIEKEGNELHGKTKRVLLKDLKEKGDFDAKSYVRDEFDLIRSAFPLSERDSHDTEGYFEYKRTGRSIAFTQGVKEHVLSLLLRYEEYMFAGGLMDELGLGQAVHPLSKELNNLPPAFQRDCLLIDEFQDFSTLELQFLKRIPSSAENGLFLAGDLAQKVMVKDFDLSKAYLQRGDVKSETIKKNYRNSRQILEAADALVQKYGANAKKADENFEIINPEFAVRETSMPIALKCESPVATAWNKASEWIKDGEHDPWSVCLVSSNPKKYTLESIISECPESLQAKLLDGDYVENRDFVSVGTLGGVKGFEFSLIVVIGCSEESIPDLTYPKAEQWREALRFYVAMTRGRDQVVLTYESKPSEFLLCMKPLLKWEDSSSA